MVGVDVEKIEHDIRTAAITRRLRPSLFFVDYDRLRCGLVSESQFMRVLWENMAVKLSDEEQAALVDKYAVWQDAGAGDQLDADGAGRRVDWRRFVDAISLPFDAADVTNDPACQRVRHRVDCCYF